MSKALAAAHPRFASQPPRVRPEMADPPIDVRGALLGVHGIDDPGFELDVNPDPFSPDRTLDLEAPFSLRRPLSDAASTRDERVRSIQI